VAKLVNERVSGIISQYIGDFDGRVGVTMGMDKGQVIMMRLYGNKEYMGKAINAAARFQSLLKLPEESNKLIVSAAVKADIQGQLGGARTRERKEVLRNLYGNEAVPCFEIDLL
jgi:hypothetical protein